MSQRLNYPRRSEHDKLGNKYTSATAAVLKIIPSEEIDIVIARGQRYSTECWWWGNRANTWVEYALSSGELLTKGDAILALSQVSGISTSTLRYYAAHAAFFNKDVQEYYEPLPFSHFATAKSHGDEWPKILQTSLDYLEQYGRLPSANYLDWLFSRNAQPVLEVNEELKQDEISRENEYLLDISQIDPGLETEGDFPIASEATARDWMDRVDSQIRTIAKSINPLPISEQSKHHLRYAVQNLSQALEAAYKEISVPDPANQPHGAPERRTGMNSLN